MKKILKMLKPFRGTLVFAIVFSALYSVLEILIPIYTKYILSEGIIAKSMDNIIKYGLIMLAFTLAGVVTSLLNTYFSTKTSVNYATHIRNIVFSKVSHLSQSDVDKIGVSSMMTRTTNDVSQVHDFILSALKSILPVPIMLVGGLVMAYQVNRKLLKIIFIVIPVLLVLMIILLVLIMPMYSKIQKYLDKINFVLRGKISGIRVIRAFNKTKYEDDRFDETNNGLTRLSLKAARIMSTMMPVLVIALYSLICYIIYMCVNDATVPGVSQKVILETIPNMYMFISYFTLIITAVGTVISIIIIYPKAAISAKRVSQILDAVSDIKEPENPVAPDEDNKGTVEFRNVSFRYKPQEKEEKKKPGKLTKKMLEKQAANKPKNLLKPEEKKELTDRDAVHDISFTAHPGEITAIIGITGCGKSSLINLIPRLYDVSDGAVLVDGVDVRDMSLNELHKRIAYVPQQSYLFSGSVKDNIKFGNPDASDSEVWKAIEIAQAKSFVSSMQDGIDSFVSQAGKNYSGGQKQRLAIARAIIKNAEICILDDSFSALDLATDARLRASLRENLPDTNIFIVAQRVGTVINADRIIVMDNGEAVGIGTHTELLEKCEAYKSIVESQLSDDTQEAAV